MPIRYITSDHIGPGVQIVGGDPPPIGSGGFIIAEDLHIAEGVLIARTDAFWPEHYTVYQKSLGQVTVHGTIDGFGIALQMGDAETSSSGNLTVGETGVISSSDNVAVKFQGAAQITNSGRIEGNQGMIVGDVDGTVSFKTFITNLGTIWAEGAVPGSVGQAILRNADSQEEIRLMNEGLIRSMNGSALGVAYDSAYHGNTARDVIFNEGRIIGNVLLGHGNDHYDGRDGRLRGLVDGGTGNDVIRGGANAEQIQGSAGADTLSGGRGADVFIYYAASDSRAATGRDRIVDFNRGQLDILDLSDIDANSRVAGNQAFRFIGSEGFHGSAGELRYARDSAGTHVMGDINGDRRADFVIDLTGQITFLRSDFLL